MTLFLTLRSDRTGGESPDRVYNRFINIIFVSLNTNGADRANYGCSRNDGKPLSWNKEYDAAQNRRRLARKKYLGIQMCEQNAAFKYVDERSRGYCATLYPNLSAHFVNRLIL